MERDGSRIAVSADKARGGATGHNVRYVLMAGTLGAATMFVAVYLYFFA